VEVAHPQAAADIDVDGFADRRFLAFVCHQSKSGAPSARSDAHDLSWVLAPLRLIEEESGQICTMHGSSAYWQAPDFDPVTTRSAAFQQPWRPHNRPLDLARPNQLLHRSGVSDVSRQYQSKQGNNGTRTRK
jgi:hypothetical protein